MSKPEFSIIIPIKNRTKLNVNFEPPGLSIFENHTIESSGLPKYKMNRRGTDIILELLINNLKSLSGLSYNFEIILVDFQSDDYNPKKLRAEFPNVKIITEESFFSRGKGLNIGLKHSTKKNIMFCDADMFFQNDTVFKNAFTELEKGKVFFPICFDLIEPTHQVGYWRESGYGIMFAKKNILEKLNFKWSEYETLGKEDDDAFEFFNSKKLVARYKVPGYFHQWHPSSKFFKNQNYKSANLENVNAEKLLINFDDNKIEDENFKLYLKCLKEDKRYHCVKALECDTKFILNSRKLPQIIKRKQIDEYEKKYCRKIINVSMERYHVLPLSYNLFIIRYPGNPKWLNKVLDWMTRIEIIGHQWTLHGSDKYQLSSSSLFAKLIKIYGGYHEFDKIAIRNKILKFLDAEDSMFKQDKEVDRIISESRQSYSALINMGYGVTNNEKYNVNLEKYFPEPLYFMTDSYWENPWRAGAHLSHYVFFCYLKNDYEKIEKVFERINKKYFKGNGWYHGNPSEEQILNGIMKVFTAYDVIGKKLDNYNGIVDRLLKAEGYSGGCGVYDYVYNLVRCLDGGYRVGEIKERLYKVYDLILEYQMPDGGFKYSKDTNKKDTYAGKEITPAGAFGSIHATTVFSMALSMMNNALGMGLNLGLAFS